VRRKCYFDPPTTTHPSTNGPWEASSPNSTPYGHCFQVRNIIFYPLSDTMCSYNNLSELYTMRTLFPGSSEADEIYKICSILGSPTMRSWPEGMRLAGQMQFRFPQFVPTPMSQVIPNASPEGWLLRSVRSHSKHSSSSPTPCCTLYFSTPYHLLFIHFLAPCQQSILIPLSYPFVISYLLPSRLVPFYRLLSLIP
jgi:hypothetical protein